MFSFLNNIPQVTKNILILNVLFFLATLVFESKGIYLIESLGAHYINSPRFEPYQIITHFFMHAGIWHLFMNMYLFVILGSYLERLWGEKRFFIFYVASAMGAFVLYNSIGMYELMQVKKQIISLGYDLSEINKYVLLNQIPVKDTNLFSHYADMVNTPMVGASGAVFGIMAAFAILFPNTEFMIYFAIPVKAKFLVGGYFLWELYNSIYVTPGDNVAHLAHVGGAIVGAAIILFWRKRDKKNFW
jgi:membrane associated rhomboid family serine protease